MLLGVLSLGLPGPHVVFVGSFSGVLSSLCVTKNFVCATFGVSVRVSPVDLGGACMGAAFLPVVSVLFWGLELGRDLWFAPAHLYCPPVWILLVVPVAVDSV